MEEKCERCGTALWSNKEREQGVCSKCLKAMKDHPGEQPQKTIVKRTVAQKGAKNETNTKNTLSIPNPIPKSKLRMLSEFPVSKGDSANIVPVSYRISRALDKKLSEELARRNESKSAYLRGLLQKALG